MHRRFAGGALPLLIATALLAGGCGAAHPRVAALGRSGRSPSAPRSTAAGGIFARAIAFASCMRAHGVPGFPDPTATGAALPPAARTGLDKRSPTFQAAQRACARLATALAALKPRKSVASQLRSAECMRAHGVAGFPDPLPGGGFDIPATLDTHAPAFRAAARACGAGGP
ncbi:MAG TPA: hypothetical protein VL977_00655 [Solirubrobacteraceae bacterium]|nr:hypothetical protein [Solirubrobacteraceae bacterium]